jgi:hypothetical protein
MKPIEAQLGHLRADKIGKKTYFATFYLILDTPLQKNKKGPEIPHPDSQRKVDVDQDNVS